MHRYIHINIIQSDSFLSAPKVEMENLQFIEEQDKQVYFELFSDNKDGLTSISGSAAGKILARSGLNNAVLAVIW